MINEIDSSQRKIDFIMQFAAALHSYGATAEGLESAMSNIVHKMGMTSQFFATPTVIMASFRTEHGQEKNSLIRVKPSGVDLEKMLELDELGDLIIERKVNLEEAYTKLEQISKAANLYPPMIEALAYGIIGATVAVFFSSGINEVLISFVISLIIGILASSISFIPQTARFFEFFAAFLVSLLSGIAYLIYPHFSIELVNLAGIIVFVPGLSLTISMTELATENLAAGTARLMQAITVFLKLGFGALLGTTLIKMAYPHVDFIKPAVNPLPHIAIYPALILAAIGFTILFRAKFKDFPWLLAACFIAYYSSYLGSIYFPKELSPFIGAFMVGLAANLYARYMKHPAAIVSMPGLILLVPGSIGFRGLSFLAGKNTIAGIDTVFQMFMTAVALVAGLLLASILIKPKRSL